MKPSPTEYFLLLLFKLTIWTFYLMTPGYATIVTFFGLDPLHPLFNFVLISNPQLRKFILFFAFNSEALLMLGIFTFKVGCVTIFLYEGIRVAGFFIGLVLLMGKMVISYLSSLSHLTDKYKSSIVHRSYRSHLKIYKVLMIIFQSLESPMKSTASLAIIAGMVGVSGCFFVLVKLPAVNEVYFTVACAMISVCGVILTKVILDTLGNLHVTSEKLLLHYKNLEIVLGMRANCKKLYLKEFYCLKAISIPVGLGTARFSKMTYSVKTEILKNMFESTINFLIAF